ncbi:MAG: hypothetical protein A3K76_00065 [Euryarchaeota archaeon RBG_13_57_23]|nr:MAG: hypothetical protein A3K76_00065 [Euryarchaeota archaeon RBG_13_57_23]
MDARARLGCPRIGFDMPAETFPPELIKRRLWLDYQYASSNPSNPLDCIHNIINELADPNLDLQKFLHDAANTMAERLCINEVTIGLKDADGVFRYKVMAGLEDSEWEAHQKLSYTLDQFDDPSLYKYKQIGKYTRLYLAEDNPYREGEEETYSKPLMLQSSRKSLEDTIEGDYLDIYIYGNNDELLGWIEISGMKNGKFPSSETIKVVELLASVIGVMLTRLRPNIA